LNKKTQHFDRKVGLLNRNVGYFDRNVGHLNRNIEYLNRNVGYLNRNIGHLNRNIGHLDSKVGHLNRNIGHYDSRHHFRGKEAELFHQQNQPTVRLKAVLPSKACYRLPAPPPNGTITLMQTLRPML
jgi:hypothetical protein